MKTPSFPFKVRAVAELSASALRGNYRAILAQVPGHELIPMIKANAYGHGAVWAARELVGLEKLNALGVATLEEGEEIRRELGAKAQSIPIVVFSGAVGWSDEVGQFCEHHGLIPVLASDESWKSFSGSHWYRRIPYELEFNTGMNRLGISSALARPIAEYVAKLSAGERPRGVLSHFAMSESKAAKLTGEQRDRFVQIRSEFQARSPETRFHLANSGAIWLADHYGLQGLTDIARPGISLYGVPPWAGAPMRGLRPVMTLKGRILTRYRLKAGEGVGYGSTYVAPKDGIEIATISAGYGDGLIRSLKGTGGDSGGLAWVSGRLERFVGIVSMDLSAVTCSRETQVGDWVEWMGANIDPWTQAQTAGTVPYELLTSVSPRVQRTYVD